MGRSGCVMALLLGAAALVGCGDDGGTNNNSSDAAVDGSGTGDTMGSGDLLISGTSCDGPFSFQLAGDERLVFYQAAGQSLVEGFAILDGQIFDTEEEAMWQTYAQTHDVLLVLGFIDEIPLAPGVVTNTFDSFFAARGVGVVGFSDSGGNPRVEIVSIDTSAMTTTVTFDMPVGGSTPDYPPGFDSFVECPDLHTATGTYTGPYEVYQF